MSKSLEEELRDETLKWLQKIEKEIKKIEVNDEKGKEFFENIKAYISDSHYFLNRDLIRAFECVVWAWAWLEIGVRVGLLSVKEF
ncbi:DUF357 domain-containing protein [Archaeoglobales archaeon]|nr:MAG: DUF357 domain-containing protein [Archaeoglobales archaeon]